MHWPLCAHARMKKYTLAHPEQFYFLHHPQILHCFKTILKYRNIPSSHTLMHIVCTCPRVHACWVHVFEDISIFLGILDTSLVIVAIFIKIWLDIAEILKFIYYPKLCSRFHARCMHAHMCMSKNIINQLRGPILTYTESFMKIWLNLVELWYVTFQLITHVSSWQWYQWGSSP